MRAVRSLSPLLIMLGCGSGEPSSSIAASIGTPTAPPPASAPPGSGGGPADQGSNPPASAGVASSGGASGAPMLPNEDVAGGAAATAGEPAAGTSGATTTDGEVCPTNGPGCGASPDESNPPGNTGGANATDSTTGAQPPGDASAGALDALREYLTTPRAARPAIEARSFASVPLSEAEAETARDLLWQDHAAWVRETRAAEAEAKAVSAGGQTLRYDYRVFGSEPPSGHSLFISLHGGGEAEASVNDQQWENQKTLYEPSEGIYLAPRAPTNTWNLWHEPHIDDLLRRLIQNFTVLESVDPNRVYVMGYSAGGDGVYQLAPRMADSWAAAAMMAGHPNDAKPDNLRNLGFTLHVGGQDTAFDRHLVAAEWGTMLEALQAEDPNGYMHEVHIHPGKGHWMDLEDAVAVPWMAGFTRDPNPPRVVWLQDDVPHERLYWLAVPPEQAQKETKVVATCSGQTIRVEAEGVSELRVRLSDSLVDLDQPITIETAATTVFTGTPARTIATLSRTLTERGDPALVYPAEVVLEL